MSKRKYTKKSSYWNQFEGAKVSSEDSKMDLARLKEVDNWEPKFTGEQIMEASQCGRTRNDSSSESRSNNAYKGLSNEYSNIHAIQVPYQYSGNYVNARDPIELCQKAYFGIPVFRNTIDLNVDFANTKIYLKGGSKSAREFIQAWLKKINIDNVKEQYFLELFRSGNVPIHRLEGEIDLEIIKKNKSYKNQKANIPLKYSFINPASVSARSHRDNGMSQYFLEIDKAEVDRMAASKEPYEKEVARKLLAKSPNAQIFYRSLPPEEVLMFFHRKMDYEYFSMPWGFGVIKDLNKKMELKNIDQAIARTIDNVILLITMGAEPTKGGVNYKHLNAVQKLMKNKSVGRVLVSDYTTKAEFIIPDLSKVVGPEKYAILNQDIKDALLNILYGDEKFSNVQTKVEVFVEVIRKVQEKFIVEFLSKEVEYICKQLKFPDVPEIYMGNASLNRIQYMKAVTRMGEVGLMPPKETMLAMNTGILPETEKEIDISQEEYKKDQEKEYYKPLTANSKGDEGGRPGGDGTPRDATNRAEASEISVKSLMDITRRAGELKAYVANKIKDTQFSDDDTCQRITDMVFMTASVDEWDDRCDSIVANPEEIMNSEILDGIQKIKDDYSLDDDYEASIIYHVLESRLKENS